MATFLFEFVGEVNDGESFERTLFYADAASHAERFHHEWLLVLEPNGLYLASHWRAKSVTDLSAMLRFASILVENRNPYHASLHFLLDVNNKSE